MAYATYVKQNIRLVEQASTATMLLTLGPLLSNTTTARRATAATSFRARSARREKGNHRGRQARRSHPADQRRFLKHSGFMCDSRRTCGKLNQERFGMVWPDKARSYRGPVCKSYSTHPITGVVVLLVPGIWLHQGHWGQVQDLCGAREAKGPGGIGWCWMESGAGWIFQPSH